MCKYFDVALRGLFKGGYDVTIEFEGVRDIKKYQGNFGIESKYENYMLYTRELENPPTDGEGWKNSFMKQKAHELTGDRQAPHLGDRCFEYFMRDQLNDLDKEAYSYLQRKRDMTERAAQLALDCVTTRFPRLKDEFKKIIDEVIE